MNRTSWLVLLVTGVFVSACGASSVNYEVATSARVAHLPGLPSRDNILSDIACPTSTACIAVGHLAPGISVAGPDTKTLIEENTGDGWQVVPSPNAGAPEVGSSLVSIACITLQNCIAVGESQTYASASTTLIEQNTGNGWTIVPSPNAPAFGGIGRLEGVACAGLKRCIAVGSYESESGIFHTLIVENAGSGWRLVPSADPSPTVDDRLQSVACAGASLCFAVGSTRSGDHDQPLVEEDTGSGWTVMPVSGIGALRGVTCLAPSTCFASGGDLSFSATTGSDTALIEEFKNGAWTRVSVPANAGLLGGIACLNPTYCISVSNLPPDSFAPYRYSVVAVELVGGSWQLTDGPSLANPLDALNGVACASSGKCIAVGDQFLGGIDALPYPKPRGTLIAERTGVGWTVQDSPNV